MLQNVIFPAHIKNETLKQKSGGMNNSFWILLGDKRNQY